MSDKPLGERNYEQFADRYAAHVESKAHNADLVWPGVTALLPDLKNKHVLDAGCGSGHYSEYFLAQGASVVAFDVTPRFVELTAARLPENVTVLQHDLAEPLLFAADATVDVVFCNLVLDYIADWTPVFQEFARVLRPKGVVVACFGHPVGDWLIFEHSENVRRLSTEAPDYFAVEAFEASWGGFGEPRPVVRSFRRPLAAMIDPLLSAGLSLERLTEPQPNDTFQQKDPQGYARFMRLPTFLCLSARK